MNLHMQENEFQQLATEALDNLADALDTLDASGDLELEYQGGIITIILPSGKQFIINKHTPSQQIWLSSPISGGLHFPYNSTSRKWQLSNGRILNNVLAEELKALSNIEVVL